MSCYKFEILEIDISMAFAKNATNEFGKRQFIGRRTEGKY